MRVSSQVQHTHIFFVWLNCLKMPNFQWENEVTIVKQSGSAFIGGIGGVVVTVFCMALSILTPIAYENFVKIAICIGVMLVTYFLYHKNNKIQLQNL